MSTDPRRPMPFSPPPGSLAALARGVGVLDLNADKWRRRGIRLRGRQWSAQRQSAARFAVNVSSRPMQDRGSPEVVNAAPARAAGASMCQSTPV